MSARLVSLPAALMRFSALVGSAARNRARSSIGTGQRRRITSSASCSMSHGRSDAVANSVDETQTRVLGLSGSRRISRSQTRRRLSQSSARITLQASATLVIACSSSTPSGSSTTVAPDVRARISPIRALIQFFTGSPDQEPELGTGQGQSRIRRRGGQRPGRRGRRPSP